MIENENTTLQNLWDSVKAVLRGRFMEIQDYLKKQERSHINNSTPKATRKGINEESQGWQKEGNHKNWGRNKHKMKKRDDSKNQQNQKLFL